MLSPPSPASSSRSGPRPVFDLFGLLGHLLTRLNLVLHLLLLLDHLLASGPGHHGPLDLLLILASGPGLLGLLDLLLPCLTALLPGLDLDLFLAVSHEGGGS